MAISSQEPRVFPGLLQTENYARLIVSCFKPTAREDVIAADVEARMERQEILSGENPVTAWFVIDESVLYRSFGEDAIMGEQLDRLEILADEPNIFIQALPAKAARHPGMEGPLRVLISRILRQLGILRAGMADACRTRRQRLTRRLQIST